MKVTFEVSSTVPASRSTVWRRVISPEGINFELWPFIKMTVPHKLRGVSIHEVPLGSKVGRSWFLLFGLVPIDYDDIVLAEREHEVRFLETSTMLSIRDWRHERTLESLGSDTRVTDKVSFELRRIPAWIPGMRRLVALFLKFLFRHRHRRLADYFSRLPRNPNLNVKEAP